LARDLNDEAKVPSDIDDLSALGPDPTEPVAQAAEDESMDVAALAALSNAGRRGAAAAGDGKSAEARVDLAQAKAAVEGSARAPAGIAPKPAPPSGAAAASVAVQPPSSASRWWLPLAIGIGVGVAVSAVVFSVRPAGSPASSAAVARDTANPAKSVANGPADQPPSAAKPHEPAAAPPPASPASAAALPGATSLAAAQPAANQAAQPRAAAAPGAPAQPATDSVLHQPSSKAAPPSSASERGPGAPPVPGSAARPKSALSAPVASVETAKTAPPDSEEARLAAAAVRGNSADTPLDAVLDDAFARGSQPRTAAAAPGLALAPSRDDVIKAMTVLVPAIRGCSQGQSGLATAAIVVRNDGRVETVSVTGQPFEGTASGRCMEGVVRRARFPRFQQASFRVQFPFSIQ
jgi:hypothetical protein